MPGSENSSTVFPDRLRLHSGTQRGRLRDENSPSSFGQVLFVDVLGRRDQLSQGQLPNSTMWPILWGSLSLNLSEPDLGCPWIGMRSDSLATL